MGGARRSRRIQSQSDDELSDVGDDASVASSISSTRRTRSSSIASVPSVSSSNSATRRSARSSNNKQPPDNEKMDTILETAADTTGGGGPIGAATPDKSATKTQTPTTKKKQKKGNAKTPEHTKLDESKEKKSSTKSSKNKRKKSMDYSTEEQVNFPTTVVSTPPTKAAKDVSSPKKKKGDSSPKRNSKTIDKPKGGSGNNKSSTNTKQSPHKKKQSNKNSISPSPKTKKQNGASSSQQEHHQAKKKHKPVLDTKVHRLRFLKIHPRAILAMSSTPPSSDVTAPSSSTSMRLAISREGGSVELLSPQDRWVRVGNVPGIRGREVDALVWVCGKRGSDSRNTTTDDTQVLLGSQESQQARLVDEQRRLFGCSRDGTIFEIDFATKRQRGVIGSGGGGVFCLTPMCSRGKCCCSEAGKCGGYFAAGCEDGSVKIYSAFDGDGEVSRAPQLVATLPNAGHAVLSLSCVPGSQSGGDGGMGGSVIYAGVADGTIRRFDCITTTRTGPISTGTVLVPSRGSTSVSYRWKSTLRMTVENRGLRESTKVWALEALSDGTLISGDSLGHVQIWDGMSGTMTQTFRHNESGADVLCLAVSDDENKIFAGGIDSSVRCFQRQSSPSLAITSDAPRNLVLHSTPVRKWISSTSHRKHSHDVKALAICYKSTNNSSKPIELVVSGSVDTRICTYMANDFKGNRPRIWYNWPTLSPISVSCKQRLLAVTRDTRVDLYRLSGPDMKYPNRMNCPEARDESKSLVKTIDIQSPFNICSSVISDDGRFLAVSDALSLYVFSLDIEDDEDGILFDVHPTKLPLNSECKYPATALRFDNSGRLICATNNGPINILRISPVADGSSYKVSLEHAFKEHMNDWPPLSHHFPVASLDVSSDGKWLAAGRFSSGKGAVHVFTLPPSDASEDGRYQHWWSIPEMDAPTTCVKFLGGGDVEYSLAVGCTNNEFIIFNLGRRSLSHWSNDMGLPLLKSLPKELTSRSEPVARIISNPVAPQRLLLGSHGYFCIVDLDQPVPERASMFPPNHLRARGLRRIKDDDGMMHNSHLSRKKPKNTNNDQSTNMCVCLRYNEILFQDFISENEMVIVEEPWKSILEELPDALARKVYGT